jgi:carbon starvation protein
MILSILGGVLFCYWVALRFYAPLLERLLGVDGAHPTAAVLKKDGKDFLPTKSYVLFAHHFAAIAGAGPIVGPTLAMIYGFLPALIWVVAGAILLGGVHDMATLFISSREEGRSVADIARIYLGNGGYSLIVSFLVIGLVMKYVSSRFNDAESAEALTTGILFSISSVSGMVSENPLKRVMSPKSK